MLCALVAPADSITRSAALARDGETVTLTYVPATPLPPEAVVAWSADGGTLDADGLTATLTAPATLGYVVVTATVEQDGQVVARRHAPVLVYNQFAILKADDYVTWTGEVEEAWKVYTDFLNRERRLKHSFGIITQSLTIDPAPGGSVANEEIKEIGRASCRERVSFTV